MLLSLPCGQMPLPHQSVHLNSASRARFARFRPLASLVEAVPRFRAAEPPCVSSGSLGRVRDGIRPQSEEISYGGNPMEFEKMNVAISRNAFSGGRPNAPESAPGVGVTVG